MHAYIYIHVYMYIYIYIYTCTSVYIYICTYPLQDDPDSFLKELADEMAKSDGLSDSTTTTDEDASKVKVLSETLRNLQLELNKRDSMLAEMRVKMAAMQAASSKQASTSLPPADAASEEEDGEEALEGGTSDQAVKQRLRRMCRRRKNGTLAVPLAVHNAWKNTGPSRDELIKVFMKNGCRKDNIYMFVFIIVSGS